MWKQTKKHHGNIKANDSLFERKFREEEVMTLFYKSLAEIPGAARDSIKSEGIREINCGIILKKI
jgi:hypothetical protein